MAMSRTSVRRRPPEVATPEVRSTVTAVGRRQILPGSVQVGARQPFDQQPLELAVGAAVNHPRISDFGRHDPCNRGLTREPPRPYRDPQAEVARQPTPVAVTSIERPREVRTMRGEDRESGRLGSRLALRRNGHGAPAQRTLEAVRSGAACLRIARTSGRDLALTCSTRWTARVSANWVRCPSHRHSRAP